MEQWNTIIKTIVDFLGFKDYRIEMDAERRRGSLFVYDSPGLVKENLPMLVDSLNLLMQLIAKKNGEPAIVIDINNYRQERENLISELARAAAKKVLATKQEVSLPAMNSYERRLVHMALAVHPEVKTESIGEGRDRYVIIKLVEEK